MEAAGERAIKCSDFFLYTHRVISNKKLEAAERNPKSSLAIINPVILRLIFTTDKEFRAKFITLDAVSIFLVHSQRLKVRKLKAKKKSLYVRSYCKFPPSKNCPPLRQSSPFVNVTEYRRTSLAIADARGAITWKRFECSRRNGIANSCRIYALLILLSSPSLSYLRRLLPWSKCEYTGVMNEPFPCRKQGFYDQSHSFMTFEDLKRDKCEPTNSLHRKRMFLNNYSHTAFFPQWINVIYTSKIVYIQVSLERNIFQFFDKSCPPYINTYFHYRALHS